MWIIDQYGFEFHNTDQSSAIFIADNFDVEISHGIITNDDMSNSVTLGSYDPAGRTQEVFNQIVNAMGIGTRIFRMPER